MSEEMSERIGDIAELTVMNDDSKQVRDTNKGFLRRE